MQKIFIEHKIEKNFQLTAENTANIDKWPGWLRDRWKQRAPGSLHYFNPDGEGFELDTPYVNYKLNYGDWIVVTERNEFIGLSNEKYKKMVKFID